MDGWKGRPQAYCNLALPALIVEILQGACAGRADNMTEEEPLGFPQHLFAFRTFAILLGCSAMASGGKGYYAAQAAASSSSGGDPAPGWRAADSLMMIAKGAAVEGE